DAALRYQTMGDLIPDLQHIRGEYESGQFTPKARRAGVEPKPEMTGPDGGGFRFSRRWRELIVASIVLAVAAGVYEYSLRTVKPPPATGAAARSANPAAYDAYMRGMVSVSSENPADN